MARKWRAYTPQHFSPRAENRYKTALMKKLLSKKDLCLVFGLYSPKTNIMYYKSLRDKVMTNEVLQKIGLTPVEYRWKKVFNAETTTKILEILKIEIHELEN